MRRYAVVTAVLFAFAASAGILIAVKPLFQGAVFVDPPRHPISPTPPARPHAYKQVYTTDIPAVETGAHVSVGVWMDNNATTYRPGDTLTVVIGMKPRGRTPVTVMPPETAPFVSVRIIVHAPVKTIDPRYKELSSVDLLAQQLSQTGVGGWAIAWQPSEKQLLPLRRTIMLPDPRYRARSFMGEGWVEVGRIEIPHDEVGWGGSALYLKSQIYLEVNGYREELMRSRIVGPL